MNHRYLKYIIAGAVCCTLANGIRYTRIGEALGASGALLLIGATVGFIVEAVCERRRRPNL
jgi:hypothetical protein